MRCENVEFLLLSSVIENKKIHYELNIQSYTNIFIFIPPPLSWESSNDRLGYNGKMLAPGDYGTAGLEPPAEVR